MEDLKTVSCSIVFVANNAPDFSKKKIYKYTNKDDIFVGLMSSITLKLILKSRHPDKGITVTNIKEIPNLMSEFKSSNGLRFIFERPLKLSIIYDSNIGDEKNPEQYVKDIANDIIKECDETKIGSVGIDYEFFEKCESPNQSLKTVFLSHVNDDSIGKLAIVLAYEKNAYTIMNLSISNSSREEKTGLLYKINFDCKIRGKNNVTFVLEESDLKEFAKKKIQSLLKTK